MSASKRAARFWKEHPFGSFDQVVARWKLEDAQVKLKKAKSTKQLKKRSQVVDQCKAKILALKLADS